jgi:hypothetical protein
MHHRCFNPQKKLKQFLSGIGITIFGSVSRRRLPALPSGNGIGMREGAALKPPLQILGIDADGLCPPSSDDLKQATL